MITNEELYAAVEKKRQYQREYQNKKRAEAREQKRLENEQNRLKKLCNEHYDDFYVTTDFDGIIKADGCRYEFHDGKAHRVCSMRYIYEMVALYGRYKCVYSCIIGNALKIGYDFDGIYILPQIREVL